ncbi:amidohydrolase family protein, partial [bacterium]|nr:amidohydrolase family protein [bacterium]
MFCDWLFTNGRIWTVNPQQPWAEVLAVSGNRILAVGKGSDLKSLVSAGTQIVDLKGRLLLPGFNDAHLHFENGGESLIGIQLRDAANPTVFVQRIAEYVETMSVGEWIIGGEWDHEIWPEQQLPTRDWIDAVTPNHPVLVERLDEHVQLANRV